MRGEEIVKCAEVVKQVVEIVYNTHDTGKLFSLCYGPVARKIEERLPPPTQLPVTISTSGWLQEIRIQCIVEVSVGELVQPPLVWVFTHDPRRGWIVYYTDFPL